MRRIGALTVGALALASVLSCTSTSTVSPATSTPSPTTSTVSPTMTATAEGALVEFAGAARAADARLRHAAELINGSIRPDAVAVDGRTVAAVLATDPSPVAAAIPAGMPPRLMLPVLTVYSDLVSRSAAMGQFRHAQTYPRTPSAGQGFPDAAFVLGCLKHGAPAAHRFAADLAAVLATARSTPPLKGVRPASLASAELAVRLEDIQRRNNCSDECGGYVATSLAPIVWDHAAPTATTRSGSIANEGTNGRIRFTATYSPRGGWTVNLAAC
jgi:hypothetical protein